MLCLHLLPRGHLLRVYGQLSIVAPELDGTARLVSSLGNLVSMAPSKKGAIQFM